MLPMTEVKPFTWGFKFAVKTFFRRLINYIRKKINSHK